MDKDFKWPQVWRTSLGIDHKFENNYIATLDMSYNKDINGSRAKLGIKTPSGSLRGNDQKQSI
jgi:hypothetical protein